jgi:hypothetical protein
MGHFRLKAFQLRQGDDVLGRRRVAVFLHTTEVGQGGFFVAAREQVEAKEAARFGQLVVVGGLRQQRRFAVACALRGNIGAGSELASWHGSTAIRPCCAFTVRSRWR